MIFDHVALTVGDFARARAFFREALMPLGIDVTMERDGVVGMGREGRSQFFVAAGEAQRPMHIAFSAATREDVRAFHRAALAAGGSDHGAPGIRAQYAPNYYAAFVIGPEGHNIEAVSRTPTE